jgi:uncharacterized protein (DUF433 family)
MLVRRDNDCRRQWFPPMFVGTRVPEQALIDYREGGHSLTAFLEDVPTVPQEIVIAALGQAHTHA